MTDPRRETTETRICLDCRDDTTHLVLEWPSATTFECADCRLVTQGDPR